MSADDIKNMIAAARPSQQPTVDLLRGDMVKIEPIDWLWAEWLARGKFHILAGIAGTGKTTIALSFAATITFGGVWPDGSQAPMGDVVIWSGEDDPSDTLAPRLKAMGADMRRVHFVNGITDGQIHRSFDPATDIEALAEAVKTIAPILLIVDPVVSAVAGDSHKNTETRRALQPLVDIAFKSRIALLGISHFSKGSSGRNPIERVTGSLAFAALARVVLVAAKLDNEEEKGRIFCRAKSNIGDDEGGFRYDLEQKEIRDRPDMPASCVIWGSKVEGSAQTLLGEAETLGNNGSSLSEAMDFLKAELGSGEKSAKELEASAELAGIAWRTIKRASKSLDVKPRKIGMKGGWIWSLPTKNAKSYEESQQKEVASFNEIGTLQTMTAEQTSLSLEKLAGFMNPLRGGREER